MDLPGLPITLVVKAPNQKVADQTIECELSWDVLKLKRHLTSVYPSSPGENQQRIIYSGRLLEDDLVLKDVLRQYEPNQTKHIVHLVCSRGHMDMTEEPPASSSSNDLRRRNVNSSGSNENINTTSTTTTTANESSPAEASQAYFGAQQLPTGAAANMYAGYPGAMPYMNMPPMPGMMYTPEQIMWMQQMYTQQVAQYMQYYGNQAQTLGVPQPSEAEPAAAAEPAPANARARPAGPQPIRMNAQGGAWVDDDDDEDGGNRDWLDWVYTLSRFSVLLSIVYFYSTISRFILVFGFFALVYLYQAGWFRPRRPAAAEQQEAEEAAQPAPQPPQPEQQAQQPEPAPAPPNDGEGEAETPTTEERTEEPQAPAEPPPPSAVQVAWSFVSTFFTSLVPQQPAAVNAN